jgi:D-hydroxyproline dehydrogenase subunit beta
MAIGQKQIKADVCVVGAGIVGLAHAHEALRRGLSVVVLEREHEAVGASVRNFGHLFVSGLLAGESYGTGLRSRERWLELAPRAGLALYHSGTLLVARADDELGVLEGWVSDPQRHGRLLTAEQAAEAAPVPIGALVGALHTEIDLRTNPREAVRGLARLLVEDGGRIEWNAAVHEIEPGAVHTAGLTVSAAAIVVCPGPNFRELPPAVRPSAGPMTLCRLQMLRTAAPAGRTYRPALATALSLIRYPAFATQPAAAALRARLEREKPEHLENGVHLLVTQLPDGDLIIGDSHAYGDTLAPFGEERLDQLLLDEAEQLLGERPLVKQRWHGIYPSADSAGGSRNFAVSAPIDGVRVVECISGLGMTLSLGHAPVVMDELLS